MVKTKRSEVLTAVPLIFKSSGTCHCVYEFTDLRVLKGCFNLKMKAL
jgi:hypothetical protein